MGLESVELVLAVEREFEIAIPDAVIEKLITVGDFYDAVYAEINRQRPELIAGPDFKEALWARIAQLSAELGYRVTPEQITRESRFSEDLGYG